MTRLPELLLVEQPQLDALPALAPALLDWYGYNARSLPWREDVTPYRVWVSEIMLQQTRVEAVRGYFPRFIHAAPSVARLASLPEDALLKLWEGLGYYSRARNLQRAAAMILEQHDGVLPASYAQLRQLPGIGEYTAGAVASIAFGIPVPAVDGNVYRVISRILGSYADTSRPAVKAAFREAVQAMLPIHRPGDFNQSLMELGATVCLPGGNPLCRDCPVSSYCAATAAGIANQLPVKAEKKPRRREQRTILMVVAEGKLLLYRRKNKGLLAGMYEPPSYEGHLTRQETEEELKKLGGKAIRITPLSPSKHLFTHIQWQMEGYLIYSDAFPPGEGLWAGHDTLIELAIPSAYAAYFKGIDGMLCKIKVQ